MNSNATGYAENTGLLFSAGVSGAEVISAGGGLLNNPLPQCGEYRSSGECGEYGSAENPIRQTEQVYADTLTHHRPNQNLAAAHLIAFVAAKQFLRARLELSTPQPTQQPRPA